MKAFNYLRILFLAIFSLSIISCDNNDEDNGLLGSQVSSSIPDEGTKKLVQMNKKYKNGEEDKYYFKYNKDGILVSLSVDFYEDGRFDESELISLVWTENNLILTSNRELEPVGYYEISDGKIIKELLVYDDPECKYDNNGCLMYMSHGIGYIYKTYFTWEDGKLMNSVESWSDENDSYTATIKYLYSSDFSKKCNGFFPEMPMYYLSKSSELCALPWLIGMKQQYLPEEIETEIISCHSSHTSIEFYKDIFTYTFYGDGYLKGFTQEYSRIINSVEVDNDTYVYEYFWE